MNKKSSHKPNRIFILTLAFILVAGLAITPTAQGLADSVITRPKAASPDIELNDQAPPTISLDATYPALRSESLNTLSSSVCTSVFQTGGDRLAALQNDDGGWDWPLDDGDPTNTSPLNTVGPIAMGLAQAYLHTGDPSHLTALQQAGALLVTKTNNFSPSDGYMAAILDQIFGGTTYVDHVITNFYDPLAAGTYNRNGAGTLYDTAGYVNLIRTARANQGIGNLAAWDIGMGLVGAASAGADTTAWVTGLKAEIDELDGNDDYDVIGLAGAVYGLAFVGEDYDPTAGEHAAASSLGDLAAILAGYQIDGGGFTWNKNNLNPGEDNETIQETAYAVLALNEFDRDAYYSAIQGAANYMLNAQLATGGWKNWAGGWENNEVTGEALWALSIAQPGPVTANVTVSSNLVSVNESVVLTASVDNASSGCNNISSAEYSLDDVDWFAMNAVDGSFDGLNEDVTISFDAPATAGIFDLCVHGIDVVGNIGDPECIMLVVYDPEGGFVTGGGWIDSPPGAYMPLPGGVEYVTPENIDVDWFSPDIRGDGYIAFVNGPTTPPLSVGSLEMGTSSGSDKAQFFNYDYMGVLLTDIEALSYATYRHSTSTNPPAQYPAINIEVDYVGDGSSYTTLVWEPIYSYGQSNLSVDAWQTWDTMAPSQTGFGGGWWSTKSIPGVCAFNCFVDWETIINNNPDAKIKYAIGVNIGSGWNGIFTGSVDELSITISSVNTTYDFEPEAPFNPTGRANFGFVSKFQKGAEIPSGNTEFAFQAADLYFHSSAYHWLVVNRGGTNAQFKGTGTINGEGEYKFMLWAGDGEPDTFRIRIWEEDEFGVETMIYDNGMDQAIGGGNIVVHTKK